MLTVLTKQPLTLIVSPHSQVQGTGLMVFGLWLAGDQASNDQPTTPKMMTAANTVAVAVAIVPALVSAFAPSGFVVLPGRSFHVPVPATPAFGTTATGCRSTRSTAAILSASLKPAALPLLDSGKAIARSGELLIDVTSVLDLYGGGLSSAGACLRNSGDAVAQAAASCRFKTAAELVTDELREGATCINEGVDHLKRAVEEAETDENAELVRTIGLVIPHMKSAGIWLEAAGAGIMTRVETSEVGTSLVECGSALEHVATSIRDLAPEVGEASQSCDRLTYGAIKMKEAGDNLRGVKKEKPKGKAWLKG